MGAGIASLLAVLVGPTLTLPPLTAPPGSGGSSDGGSSGGDGGGGGGDGGGVDGGSDGGGGGGGDGDGDGGGGGEGGGEGGGGDGGDGGGGGGGGGEGADVRPVRCYAYSPPAVLSLAHARAVAGHVTSVVLADDLVPKPSPCHSPWPQA